MPPQKKPSQNQCSRRISKIWDTITNRNNYRCFVSNLRFVEQFLGTKFDKNHILWTLRNTNFCLAYYEAATRTLLLSNLFFCLVMYESMLISNGKVISLSSKKKFDNYLFLSKNCENLYKSSIITMAIASKTIILPHIWFKVMWRLSTQIVLRMNGSMPKIISKWVHAKNNFIVLYTKWWLWHMCGHFY